MKTVGKLVWIAVFMLTLPLAAAAGEGMQHMEQKEGMSHGKMQGMENGGMEGMEHGKMMEGMAMIGDQTVEGVKAMAHVKDVKAAMAKMGMKETHHFMIAFVDAAGKPVTGGTVAVKIEDPAGNISEPVMLMGMQGHFGADFVLPGKGEYHFNVGTKLADGQKRQYDFRYTAE